MGVIPVAGLGRDGSERGIRLRPTASRIADQKQQRHTEGEHLLTDDRSLRPRGRSVLRVVGKIKDFFLPIQLSKDGASGLCEGYQMGGSLQTLSAVHAGVGRSCILDR